MLETAETPLHPDVSSPTPPNENVEAGVTTEGQIESRHVSRAERNRLFYELLSQRVLQDAGVEVSYIETEETDTTANQLPKPKGFRQRRAVKKAVELSHELARDRAFIDQGEKLRATIDAAKQATR